MNEPAFPSPYIYQDGKLAHYPSQGMSLRDYLAAKAMQAIRTNKVYFNESSESVARKSYEDADAMLAEREKK